MKMNPAVGKYEKEISILKGCIYLDMDNTPTINFSFCCFFNQLQGDVITWCCLTREKIQMKNILNVWSSLVAFCFKIYVT